MHSQRLAPIMGAALAIVDMGGVNPQMGAHSALSFSFLVTMTVVLGAGAWCTMPVFHVATPTGVTQR